MARACRPGASLFLLGCLMGFVAGCGSRDARYLKAQRALRECQVRVIAEVTEDWVRQGKAPEALVRAWGPAGPQNCKPIRAVPRCEAFWDEVRDRSFAHCQAEHEAVANATRGLLPFGETR